MSAIEHASPKRDGKPYLTKVPPELLISIFTPLHKRDKLSVRLVCKQFRDILTSQLFKALRLRFTTGSVKDHMAEWTHCKLHGWYDHDADIKPVSCNGDLSRGIRFINLSRETPYGDCPYFSSNVEENRSSQHYGWSTRRLRMKEPITAFKALSPHAISCVENIIVALPQNWTSPGLEKDGPLNTLIRELALQISGPARTPRLRSVYFLVCLSRYDEDNATWTNSVSSAVALLRSLVTACSSRKDISLHITLYLYFNNGGPSTAPLDFLKAAGDVSSLSLSSTVDFAFGEEWNAEIKAMIARSPMLQADGTEVLNGRGNGREENERWFHFGPRQDEWIMAHEGKYNDYMQGYRAMDESLREGSSEE